MKKIMISLLMVAASLNAMAISYSGKAKLTLKSSDNKSCVLSIAESADLSDGLNSGYYAELNEEGKEVLFYVTYAGVNYQSFVSSPATMQDLQLGVKTNASTSYTLTASNVSGSLKIRFNGVEYTISSNGVVFSDVVLPASSVLPAAGDEEQYRVQPSAQIAQSICFRYNELHINGHAGEALVVEKDGAPIETVASLPAFYSLDLSAQSGRLVVKLGDKEYQIDANPQVKPAN